MEVKNVYRPRNCGAHYYFISCLFSLEPPKTIVRLDDTQITVDGYMGTCLSFSYETGAGSSCDEANL